MKVATPTTFIAQVAFVFYGIPHVTVLLTVPVERMNQVFAATLAQVQSEKWPFHQKCRQINYLDDRLTLRSKNQWPTRLFSSALLFLND